MAGRRGTFAVVLTFLAFVASRASAEGIEDGRSAWITLAPGLWHRDLTIARADSGVPAHAFRADPKIVRVTMLDASREGRRVSHVSMLRQESSAYLAVNASFFDPEQRPLGLVVGDGREHSRLRRVDQGIFLIANGEPRIQHTRDPLPDGLEMAVQAFPRLIVDGRPLRLKPNASRRTAVCVPGDGTAIIIVVPTAVSLADLAENLARPATRGGLGCWAALNLDGGPSTQLSVGTSELSLDVPGGWGVPNALAVLPR